MARSGQLVAARTGVGRRRQYWVETVTPLKPEAAYRLMYR